MSRMDAEKVLFKEILPVNVQVRGLTVAPKSSKKKKQKKDRRGLRKRSASAGNGKANVVSQTKAFEDGSNTEVESVASSSVGDRVILHETSFDLPQGKLMAIIGGSGSGKTTMLNVLAQRSNAGSLHQTGVLRYGGGSLDTVRHAYVIQQDILSPMLTTRETLQFAIELRLPDSHSKEERLALVEEVILELGLKDCADTMVGDSTHKGLSGGEKRRLSIGIQILSNPSLLFLDEPTTGLDAYSAFLLIMSLKKLTERGRTIIISIHQPRSDIFFLFDYLCILSRGQTVYAGSIHNVLPYFASLGYTVPEDVNPSDFLIDITAVDARSTASEKKGLERLQMFAAHWRRYSQTMLQPLEGGDTDSDECDYDNDDNNNAHTRPTVIRQRIPLLREIFILYKRTMLLTTRDTATLAALFSESIIMGIICGWVYYQPAGDLAGIRTISAAIYSSCALQGYLMLLFEVYRLCSTDIKIFDRERADHCVSIAGFLISRRMAKLFTEDVPISFLFAVITYFMYGLQSSASKFFIYWTGIFLSHLASMTGAVFAVAISRKYAQASLVSNMNYTLQSFACGFFVNTQSIPVYTRWTKYIAYLWYAFGAMMVNQFSGYSGDCPYQDQDSTQCQMYQGEYIIASYNFDLPHWIVIPLFVVLAWSILFYVAAALLLKLNPVDVSLTKQLKQGSASRELEEIEQTKTDSGEPIDITLNNIYLSVTLRKKFTKMEKVILHGINATFKSGRINAILGPSGSGKSSLLNLIAGRTLSGLLNRYSSSGDIMFNELKVSTDMMNSLCSYVSQEDDHLLASLSVRETLVMAADLRLRHLDKQQRSGVVDGIIAKLGLRGCANTLIGSEFKKGISGGEKRRVAIGIQLLNNPKVLFLDEPTSGLDSFTASTILEILNNLASEGKTIIITIHQPRLDLFNKFGEILLLAKGGSVAYNGPQSTIMDYFQSLGYPCPRLTNCADHILDLISVNNQSMEQELDSKSRINSLLKAWEQRSTSHSYTAPMTSSEQFKHRFGEFIRQPCAFVPALISCFHQQLLTTVRNTDILMAKIMNPMGVGIVVALWMAPLKDSYEGIQDRLGCIQQVTALYFCGMLNNLAAYPQQRNYFYHEHADRVHGILPFFLAYTLLEIPMDALGAMIAAAFFGPITGLPRTAEMYFALAYCIFIIMFCGESLGIATNTLFDDAGFAVNSVSILLSIGTFMGGIMSLDMDSVLKGINYVSPLKYTTMILVNMGFPSSVEFRCPEEQLINDPNCIIGNGTYILQEYGLLASYTYAFGVLVAVALVYRFIAYVLLRLKLLKISLGVFNKKHA